MVDPGEDSLPWHPHGFWQPVFWPFESMPSPLILRQEANRSIDVGTLCSLAPSAEHDYDSLTVFPVIHSIPRPKVHAKLPDPIAQVLVIPEITRRHPVDAAQDGHSGHKVFKLVDPRLKRVNARRGQVMKNFKHQFRL